MLNTRVCHITTVHRPFDVRIFHRMCCSLSSNHYEVHLIARKPKISKLNGVFLHSIPYFQNRIFRMTFGVFCAFWKCLILKPNVIHLHDPELIPIGILFKALGAKVIFDMHELVSSQLKDKEYLKANILNFIIDPLYSFFEFLALKYFDSIVLAEEGYFKPLKKKYYNFKQKFCIIRNYPSKGQILNIAAKPKVKGILRVVYIGGLMKVRGTRELIEAVGKIPNARLSLAGPWSCLDYRNECESLKSFDCVDYHGYLSFEEAIRLVKKSHIAAAPLHPVTNNLLCRTTKFYEYALCKIPIILSNFRDWEQTFAGMAWFADPTDANDLHSKIIEVQNDRSKEKKINYAFQKVLELWNWEKEQEILLHLYSRILTHQNL